MNWLYPDMLDVRHQKSNPMTIRNSVLMTSGVFKHIVSSQCYKDAEESIQQSAFMVQKWGL